MDVAVADRRPSSRRRPPSVRAPACTSRSRPRRSRARTARRAPRSTRRQIAIGVREIPSVQPRASAPARGRATSVEDRPRGSELRRARSSRPPEARARVSAASASSASVQHLAVGRPGRRLDRRLELVVAREQPVRELDPEELSRARRGSRRSSRRACRSSRRSPSASTRKPSLLRHDRDPSADRRGLARGRGDLRRGHRDAASPRSRPRARRGRSSTPTDPRHASSRSTAAASSAGRRLVRRRRQRATPGSSRLVYVAEGARGRGVGRALMERSLADAGADGIWTIQTASSRRTPRASRSTSARVPRSSAASSASRSSTARWRDTILLELRARA